MSTLRSFLSAALIFTAAPFVTTAQTAALPASHEVEDGGQRKVFEVALDEIAVYDPNGKLRVEKQAAASTAEAMRRNSVARKGELVVYEKGSPRTEATRRIVRRQIAVRLAAGGDLATIAAAAGLTIVGPHPSAAGYFICEAPDAGTALTAAATLRTRGDVLYAETQLARQQSKRFTPNDPLYAQQWHLKNTGQGSGVAGTDVNITTVWDTYKGEGMRIAIVDDGLQTTHPDLSPNVDTATPTNHHDWNDSTPDTPTPDTTVDFHGSSCAGVAAGRGNNGIGVSGSAPLATLVGLRLIAAGTTDSEEAEAMAWKNDLIFVKSNSWGPNDDGLRLEGPGTLTKAALQTATTTGRGGKGTIFLWAGGNGGDVGDNSNYDGYANSIYTIAIGAVGNNGLQAYYSEPGANLVVTAPSNGGSLGIVTTDLTGTSGYNTGSVSGELSDNNYTNDFGGTSSATPLAAGCVALLLQSKPSLGWRDVQEILIRSATKVNATDTDWVNNAAGFHFNHKYGAGLINTQAAVALAANWTNLAAQTSTTSSQTSLSVAIPDNNSAGITRSFDLSASNLRVEQVTVTVNINHTSRGQLAVTLTSPSGTASRLAEKHSDTGDNYASWTFSTVRSWGENSQGIWTLKVADLGAGTTGTLTSAVLTVYGTPAGPVNQPPVITAASLSGSGMVFTDQTLSVPTVSASDAEGDAITLSYQWQQTSDNVNFTDISGGTSSTLALSETYAGKLIRCRITPTSAGQAGAAFTTSTVAVNRRPVRTAQLGTSYSYDSELFLAASGTTFSRELIINEFSQGLTGSQEWIELLMLKTADLRGFTIGDRQGTYTTFASVSMWSAVPAGTLIVVLNGSVTRDGTLPATDDLNATDGTLVIAHNNASAFTAGTWGGLSNTNPESLVVKNASGVIVDALSINSENVYDPKLAAVGAGKCAYYTGDTDTGADTLALWTIGSSSLPPAGLVTPAAGNGGLNTTFVTNLRSGVFNVQPQFRLGATSDSVPGLTINSSTGVLAGTPTSVGLYNIVIERFAGTDVSSQSFSLLVGDNSGNATVAAGKGLTLDASTSVTGNLVVDGSLDTAGQQITVSGTLTVRGSIVNSTGVISYLHRSGALPPGQIRLIANAANDIADPDGDGLSNLAEFFLGTDPSSPGGSAFSATSPGNRLTLTYNVPVGIGSVFGAAEVSGDLGTWNSGTGFTEVMSDTSAGSLRTLTVRDAIGGANRFIRLRVSR